VGAIVSHQQMEHDDTASLLLLETSFEKTRSFPEETTVHIKLSP
jgi:hypothetical protein